MEPRTHIDAWHTWSTADFWPDWDGITECNCGAKLDEMPGNETNCTECGLDLRELVYPHCAVCEEMIVGLVYTHIEWGDDFCEKCYVNELPLLEDE